MNETRLIRFLLVEDDDAHAAITMRVLQRNQVLSTVVRVADGEAALTYLRSADRPRPDVVLLDLNLPKIDGHEVLAQIKHDPELCTIPIVVLTTSDTESDRQRAYRAHVNSYLVKPIDFEGFRQLIRDLSLYWGVWNQPSQGEAIDPAPGGGA